ncbi:hypothetical protein HRbin21_01366 [bacterium HR21]|nr:hypothetical protein HRbin21_01366 [bacterium HR21]
MDTQRTYDRRRLEQMVPDYAFGRLSPEEAREVERQLHRYPELLREVEELRAVFERLESMEYLRELEHRSSILSVLVLNRWKAREVERQHRAWWKPVVLFLLPTLALALFAFWWTSPSSAPVYEPVPQLSTAVEDSEPLPYAEGLLSFTYWTSGLPPSPNLAASPLTLTASAMEEIPVLADSTHADEAW